jgi:hypothetical protein
MAALLDVRNQVIRLGQEIVAMRSESPVAPDAMNAVVAELREAVRFLAERLDGVARMVAQRGEELADTRGALGAIDAHVRSQAETIGVLTTGMQALPAYGQQVSGLADNLNSLQQRLVNLEGSLGQRLGGIEQALARPPDAGISERLAAIEGMLGPLSQRLGQANSDQRAALQTLQGKLESLASGIQAGLAQPATVDDAAVSGLSQEIQSLRSDVAAVIAARAAADAPAASVDLSPLTKQLADMSGELESLRSDIAGVVAARAAGEGTAGGVPSAPVDLTPLTAQLTEVSQQVAALAAAPRGEPDPASGVDVDAAIAQVEQRIKAHVDDAVLALAQTLLGRGGGALVDEPAPPQPAAAPAGATAVGAGRGGDEPRDSDSDSDSGGDEVDSDDEAAPIDFSKAPVDDEDDVDTTSWRRPEADDDGAEDRADNGADDRADNGADDRAASWGRRRGYDDSPEYVAGAPDSPAGSADAPFDQEAGWGAPTVSSQSDSPSTVVPQRRRRWFSW